MDRQAPLVSPRRHRIVRWAMLVVTTINAKTFDITDSVTFTPFGRKAAVKQAYRSYVKC